MSTQKVSSDTDYGRHALEGPLCAIRTVAALRSGYSPFRSGCLLTQRSNKQPLSFARASTPSGAPISSVAASGCSIQKQQLLERDVAMW